MTVSSCEGAILASRIGSTFVDGSGPVVESFCLNDSVDGVIVEVGGGTYPEDISWTFTFPSGIAETGVAGAREFGSCVCELYVVELYDSYGDG